MKKNAASQVIGAEMITASDGSAFTGSVTCYVTGDGGTQAAGSVGSGACTHEGNGFHSYAPAQAETNYDHIAFTFTGSGAIPMTVQVYTNSPQTGDSYALVNGDHGLVAVKDAVDALLADIGDASASTLGSLYAILGNAAAAIAGRLPAALESGNMPVHVKAQDNIDFGALQKASITNAVPTAAQNGTDAASKVLVTPAQKIVTDANGYVTYSNTAPPTAASIADAVWDEASTGHTDAGKAGAQVWTDIDAILDDTDLIDDATSGLAKIASDAAAIKTKTDSLTFTNAGKLDGNILMIHNTTITGDGNATPWGPA